ncbi:hypothetical protein M5D96_006623, partial [Drosophila gunungcola]
AKHLLGYLRPKAKANGKAKAQTKTKLIYVAGRQMAEGQGNKTVKSEMAVTKCKSWWLPLQSKRIQRILGYLEKTAPANMQT